MKMISKTILTGLYAALLLNISSVIADDGGAMAAKPMPATMGDND